MNWKEIPKCPSARRVFSPKDTKEAADIFTMYKLQKALYTDFKRVNKSMFYRNEGNELLQVWPLGLNFYFIFKSQSRDSYIDQFFYNDADGGWNNGPKWAGIHGLYFCSQRRMSADPLSGRSFIFRWLRYNGPQWKTKKWNSTSCLHL